MRGDENDPYQRLYVSFRTPNDEWTEPVEIQVDYPGYHQGGRFSRISPDGKYLFFTKMADPSLSAGIKPFARIWDHDILMGRPEYEFNDADVFWVSADLIEAQRLTPELRLCGSFPF